MYKLKEPTHLPGPDTFHGTNENTDYHTRIEWIRLNDPERFKELVENTPDAANDNQKIIEDGTMFENPEIISADIIEERRLETKIEEEKAKEER